MKSYNEEDAKQLFELPLESRIKVCYLDNYCDETKYEEILQASDHIELLHRIFTDDPALYFMYFNDCLEDGSIAYKRCHDAYMTLMEQDEPAQPTGKKQLPNPILGEPFPWTKYVTTGDFSVIVPKEEGFDVIISLSGLTEQERYAIADDKFEIFILESNLVPFIVFKFGDVFKCDLTINIQKIKDEYIEHWFEAENEQVTIYLLEGRDTTLQAVRYIKFDEMPRIRQICQNQMNERKENIDRFINAVYDKYNTAQIMQMAAIHFTVPEASKLIL